MFRGDRGDGSTEAKGSRTFRHTVIDDVMKEAFSRG
jgi:hypothetical protein